MMRYRGLGAETNNPANAIDAALAAGNVLFPGAWAPAGTTQTQQSYNAYCDNASAWNPFNWFYCLPSDVQNVYINNTGGPGASLPGMVTPTAPTINPVTGVQSTPQADQASTLAALTAAAAAADAATNPPPAPVDCSQWYNSLNSQCSSNNTWLLAGAAALGVLVILEMVGRR